MKWLLPGSTLLAVGLTLWLVDFWIWAIDNSLSVPVARITGTAAILFGSILIAYHQRPAANLMVIGSFLWCIGVVLFYLFAEPSVEAIAMIGEAMFFLGICFVGVRLSDRGRLRRIWGTLAWLTIIALWARLISSILEIDIIAEAPVLLVSVMTVYAAALMVLLTSTIVATFEQKTALKS